MFLKNLLNYSTVSSFEAAASEKSTYNDSLHYQAGLVTGPIQIAFLSLKNWVVTFCIVTFRVKKVVTFSIGLIY